jgi:hypothetical protein
MFPYDSAGVDITLIRWMLSMTPAERLAILQDFVDFVWDAKAATVSFVPQRFGPGMPGPTQHPCRGEACLALAPQAPRGRTRHTFPRPATGF